MRQTARAMLASPETDDLRRKRLLWRATHRGIKEMDLIFGRFVTERLHQFSPDQLDDLERLIALPDQDLLAWATGTAAVPAAVNSPLLQDMLTYRP